MDITEIPAIDNLPEQQRDAIRLLIHTWLTNAPVGRLMITSLGGYDAAEAHVVTLINEQKLLIEVDGSAGSWQSLALKITDYGRAVARGQVQ